MMKTNSLKTNRTIWLGVAVWVALLLLASAQTAQAQWTTTGNDISNSNSGNVGVGTGGTAPAYKLDVLASTYLIARFSSSASNHSQLLLNAASGYNVNLTFQNGGAGKWFLGNRADNNRFSFIDGSGSVEVFTILQGGKVGIGTTTPNALFSVSANSTTLPALVNSTQLIQLGGADGGNAALLLDAFGGSPAIHFRRANGTNASKTAIASGDLLGAIGPYGYDGSNYTTTAKVLLGLSASENWSSTAQGTHFDFHTTAPGTTTRAERLRITGSGNVGIGTTTPASILTVQTTGGDTAGEKYLRVKNTNSFTGIAIDGGQAGDVDWLLLGGYPSAGDFTVRESNVGNYLTIKKTTGNVGIGTTSPGFKFDVQGGQINSSGGLCIAGDCKTAWSQVGGSSQWTTSGSNIYYNSGSVGIGTSTFGANGLLQVNGSIGLSGARQIRPASNADADSLQFLGTKLTIGTLNSHAYGYAGSGLISSVSPAATALLLDVGGNNAATAHRLKITNDATGVTGNLFYGTPTVTALYANSANGNVGIGTTSPGYPLHVKRDQNSDAPGLTVENASTGTAAAASFAVRNSTSAADALILDAVGSSFSSTGGFIQDAGAISAEAGLLGGLSIMTRANAPIRFYTNGHTNERMRIDSNGNVGIGTTPNASYKLDVAGTINATSILVNGSPISGGGGGGTITGVTAGAGLTGGGTSGAVTLNIGAGTGVTVATDSVSVNYGSGAGTAVEGNKALTITTNGSSGLSGGASVTLGAGGTVTLTNADKGSGQNIFKNVANASGTNQFSATVNNDAIRFAGTGGTTVTFDGPNKKVTIDGSTSNIAAANVTAGQFGAGNYTFPGNVTVTGTINAKYQDVAEWVPSSEQIFAGTVVVLDTTKSNQVIASTQSYDTRVAGVISAQPGITLGEGGEGKVLVATTGRVLVQVDASKGAIHIGDLLVTSDVPGVAMKSTPVNLSGIHLHRPGTIIGKALEPMEKGSGKILVLLSLQ